MAAHTLIGSGAAQFAQERAAHHRNTSSVGGQTTGGPSTAVSDALKNKDMVMVIDGEAVRLRGPTVTDLHLHEPMVPPSVAPVWGGGPPSFLRIESLGGISSGVLSPRTEQDYMQSPRSPRDLDHDKHMAELTAPRRSSFVEINPPTYGRQPSTIAEGNEDSTTQQPPITPMGISITDAAGHTVTSPPPVTSAVSLSSMPALPVATDGLTVKKPPIHHHHTRSSVTSIDRPSLVFVDDDQQQQQQQQHVKLDVNTSTTPSSSSSRNESPHRYATTPNSSKHSATIPLLHSGTPPHGTVGDPSATGITSSTSYDKLNAHVHPHVRSMLPSITGDTDSAPVTPAGGARTSIGGTRRPPKKLGALGRSPSDVKLEMDEEDDTISPLLKNPLMMRGSARIGEDGHSRHRTRSGELDAQSPTSRGIRALKRRRFGRMRQCPADGDYWSQEQLHAMYRMLDVDHDGSVSVPEFTLGLKELGFPTHNKAQVRLLQKEIDNKGTGIIRESQFVQFFRGMSRERLRRRLTGLARRRTTHRLEDGSALYTDQQLQDETDLASSEAEQAKAPPRLSKPLSSSASRSRGVSIESKAIMEAEGFGSDVTCRVIDCGVIEGEGGQFDMQTVSASDLLKILEQGKPKKWRRAIRWIDLYGHSDDLMEVLSNELELPEAIIDDVSLEQLAKITFFPEDKCMQFVVHALSLVNFPCVANPDKSAVSPYVLVEKKKYKSPRLYASQVNVLLLKDHTVVTVRKRTEDANVGKVFDPIIDDIRAMMKQKHLSLSHSLRPKELAASLLREIVEHNWSIRDYFKDWKLAIDEALKGEAQLYHLSHIIAMENLANLAAEILRRAMQVLGHLTEGWTSAQLAEEASQHADSIVLGAGTATQAPPVLTRLPSDAIGLLSPAATARAVAGAPAPIGGPTTKQNPTAAIDAHHAGGGGLSPDHMNMMMGVIVGGNDTSAATGRTPLERVASLATTDRGVAQRGLSGIVAAPNGSPATGPGGAGAVHHHGHHGSSISGRRAGVANATHWAIQQATVTRAQRAHLQARAFLYNYAHQYRDVQEHLVKLVQEFAFTREVCRALQVFHDGQREDRMGVILYTMTLVVMLLRPACILTGVYGMNFKHMPELSHEEAHPIWLIVNAVIVMGGLLYFVRKNYLDF